MKKLILVAGLVMLLVPACKKQIGSANNEKEEVQPQHPTCGMEEAMAKMSSGLRSTLKGKGEAINFVAGELLLFLDFDGAVVRQGPANSTGSTSPIISGTRFCPAPSLTAEQIAAIIEFVKDDYSPFKIKITTSQAEFDSYSPAFNKELCIITTIPQVIGMGSGVGGVAPFANLGIRLPFNPSFVFANLYGGDLNDIAMTISHESGHTLGLGHQSAYNENCGFIFDYNLGFGTGLLSFAPIMGGGSKTVTNWWAQSCLHPVYGGPQNDFIFINNQVELNADDFPDSPTGNTIDDTEIKGILGEAGDVDFIKIKFKNPGPVTVSSANIDLKVSVYNNGGHLMDEYNDPDNLGVTIPSVNGNRYLKIEAVSNANMSSQFMTGKYKVIY